jgi:hypothetical protein
VPSSCASCSTATAAALALGSMTRDRIGAIPFRGTAGLPILM